MITFKLSRFFFFFFEKKTIKILTRQFTNKTCTLTSIETTKASNKIRDERSLPSSNQIQDFVTIVPQLLKNALGDKKHDYFQNYQHSHLTNNQQKMHINKHGNNRSLKQSSVQCFRH